MEIVGRKSKSGAAVLMTGRGSMLEQSKMAGMDYVEKSIVSYVNFK